MSEIDEQQQASQPAKMSNFYKYGPIVVSIFVSSILVWNIFGITDKSGSVISYPFFYKILAPFLGIPGAYLGGGIGYIAQAIGKQIFFFGSLGHVVKSNLIVLFLPLIGMFIGSGISMVLSIVLLRGGKIY